MNEFDSFDVIMLPSLQLMSATIVPPQDRGDDKTEQALKIQLLFCGSKIPKNGDEIISQSDIKHLHRFFGDKILTKFKVGEEVFKHCRTLGLDIGSICDWQAIPAIWKMEGGTGIWYRPAALLKIDGRMANYQILKLGKPKRPAMQDAFAYFGNSGNSNNTHNAWGNDLGNLENQINAELEAVAP